MSDIERARQRYKERAWDDAYAELSRADEISPLQAEDLERLVWAAALTGRDDEMLAALERLYRVQLDAGEQLNAARSAFWLGFRLFAMGEPGRGSGWLSRCQRIVEEQDVECVERGYLLLPLTYKALATGDLPGAAEMASTAAALGDRHRDADLSALARTVRGRALLWDGKVDEGLPVLDEAMLAVTTEEVSPLVKGLVYCNVIATCQKVFALERAREWTSLLAAWCDAQPQLVTFTGSCRVHRAEVMELSGAWGDAMVEARRASEPPEDEAAADACYQQAEIYRLQGDFRAAEAAYKQANQLGREPQPGFSLLRLAQGRRDDACAAIRRVVAATTDPLQRVRLLSACVEILIASAEIEQANAACDQLEVISQRFSMPFLGAITAHARGLVLLAEGDAPGALSMLRRAFQTYREEETPYLAARVRVSVAQACREVGDEDGAKLELEAAQEVFERLGAAPDLQRLHEAIQKASAPTHGLTRRELQVLRLVAAGKTNKVIAQTLSLSEKTVDRHVSNILNKLRVASRSAATAFAYQHHLI